jgi:Rps23 Pro-64 3,4-dihydroxylase Tpa1-like proline 4-hydroxylase|eukprot:g5672.t1
MSTTTKSSFFCVLLAIGISIYYNFFIIKENILIPKRWQVNTFDLSIDTEGKQAIKITTINNFMPKQLAINMYKQLEKKYNNMDSNDLLLLSNKNFSSSNDKNKNEYESWVYASNTGGGNQKIRSNENIINRHKKAVELAGKKHFAYSKFELSPKSDSSKELIKLVREFLGDKQNRFAIEKIMGLKQQKARSKLVGLTDIFITLYEKGNFLSVHNDENSGSLAVVISLSKHWKEKYGGNLEFFCMDKKQWCKKLIPKFNSATLFLSRPHNVWHRVSQVNNQLSSGKKKKKPRRYAITSWYATSDDKIDQEYLEECNKMIGTDSGSKCDDLLFID